jgi:hypothetical protein
MHAIANPDDSAWLKISVFEIIDAHKVAIIEIIRNLETVNAGKKNHESAQLGNI